MYFLQICVNLSVNKFIYVNPCLLSFTLNSLILTQRLSSMFSYSLHSVNLFTFTFSPLTSADKIYASTILSVFGALLSVANDEISREDTYELNRICIISSLSLSMWVGNEVIRLIGVCINSEIIICRRSSQCFVMQFNWITFVGPFMQLLLNPWHPVYRLSVISLYLALTDTV